MITPLKEIEKPAVKITAGVATCVAVAEIRAPVFNVPELPQNFAQVEQGQKTRQIAAEKAGLGNPETYRQAKHAFIIDHPDYSITGGICPSKEKWGCLAK